MSDQPIEKKVQIVLTPESHRCLMDHISERSPAFSPLKNATHLQGHGATPDHSVVTCDLASAEVLLAVADRACKTAVSDIRIAIHEYRSAQS